MPSDVSKYRGLILFGPLNFKDEGAVFSRRREGLRAISRVAFQCYVMLIRPDDS